MAKATKSNGITATVKQATAAPAPKVVQAVALRGGLAVASVKVGPKNYRVKAKHNAEWAATIAGLLTKGKGTTTVKEIMAEGIPATMVGYMVRRGYLAQA